MRGSTHLLNFWEQIIMVHSRRVTIRRRQRGGDADLPEGMKLQAEYDAMSNDDRIDQAVFHAHVEGEQGLKNRLNKNVHISS